MSRNPLKSEEGVRSPETRTTDDVSRRVGTGKWTESSARPDSYAHKHRTISQALDLEL